MSKLTRQSLSLAISLGDLPAIERVIGAPGGRAHLPGALAEAARQRQDAVMRFLLPRCDATKALQRLLELKCADVGALQLLLPFSNPKDNGSNALRLAAHHRMAEVVEILLPLSDPTAGDSEALYWSAWYGDEPIMQMLLPVSDANDAFRRLELRALETKHVRGDFAAAVRAVAFEAMDRLCDEVSDATVLAVDANLPKRWARGPRVSGRLAGLKSWVQLTRTVRTVAPSKSNRI